MVKNIIVILIIVAGIAAAVLLLADSGEESTESNTSGLATVICDETFRNIMSQEIDVFEYTYPNANIMPYYLDDHTVMDSLMSMKSRLVVTARDITEEQKSYLKSNRLTARSQRIAVDAIAIIVNRENNIDELTVSELRDIMSGKTPNWSDVFPSKLGKIQVIFDNAGSSTVRYVTDSILRGEKFSADVFACENCQEVFEQVERRKNSIGVIGVSWITADMQRPDTAGVSVEERVEKLNATEEFAIDFTNRIKVMKIRRDSVPIAYKPYQLHIYNGDYPLYRSVYAIITAPTGTLQHGFYSFLTGFIGQKIILNTGVMPATVHPRMVELN